jgi:hypothetical protein
MESGIGNVMQGYYALASSMLERWSAYASEVASNLDTPGYDAAGAAADLAACASLATENGCQLAAQALEAVAILSGCGYDQNVVETPYFEAPPGAVLKLAGALVLGSGLDALPVSVVTIQPSRLAPGENAFILIANATGHSGGTYIGTVEATTGPTLAAGVVTVQVTVWITVP